MIQFILVYRITKLLIKKHKKLAVWQKKSFTLYDRVAYLVSAVVATGQGAFRPGTRTEIESDSLPEVSALMFTFLSVTYFFAFPFLSADA